MTPQLHIYNTLSRQKECFKSIDPEHVRMYVCGMTVYDYCHLGHARVMVVFDLLKRWLHALGYRVTYVRNITDIDDKIIRRALEMGIPIRDLTDRFIQAMHEDADALGIERPDAEPRATEYVAEMQAMISTLMQKRMAYRDASGDVNFSVRAFPGYGRLSGKSLDELQAGERVLVSNSKQDPLDFVLWKSAKPDEPDDAKWDAPFGVGRPGWHIECSAMSCKLLGNEFDIHGGGADLQFPHHENEIAQSVGATGEGFARFWVHNGFVRVVRDGQEDKMSKSLGNFFTIRDLLQQYDAEVLRFFILRAQYRSPLTYSSQHVDDAKASLGRLYKAVGDVQPGAENLDWTLDYESRFSAAMNDDLNTPEAVAVLFDMASAILKGEGDVGLPMRLKRLSNVLGLLGRTEQDFRHSAGHGQTDDQQALAAMVEGKIAERASAKAARDFAKADEIRKSLLDEGIVLEDVRGGETTWRRL